jgi:hypothetical protein
MEMSRGNKSRLPSILLHLAIAHRIMREGRSTVRTTSPVRDRPSATSADPHHAILGAEVPGDNASPYKGHRNRKDGTNGSGLTMGGGWINGLGLTRTSAVLDPSSSMDGHLRSNSGLTNGQTDTDVPGFEVRRDLINGLSLQLRPPKEAPTPSRLRRSARKRWRSRNALKVKSCQPLPGREAHSCESVDPSR